MAPQLGGATTPMIVTALNTCIEASMDGEKGYAIASADVRAPTLKAVLYEYAAQRADFVRALQNAVEQLGGFPENRGSGRGTAHRGFMGIRKIIEGPRDTVILGECERGERAALATYDRVFTETPLDTLPTEIRAILVDQRAAIKVAHDDVLRWLAQT